MALKNIFTCDVNSCEGEVVQKLSVLPPGWTSVMVNVVDSATAESGSFKLTDNGISKIYCEAHSFLSQRARDLILEVNCLAG